MKFQRRNLVVAFAMLAAAGCGGTVDSSSRPIMTEANHTHYHVHAVDAAHEHTHPDDGVVGGHEHLHQHPD